MKPIHVTLSRSVPAARRGLSIFIPLVVFMAAITVAGFWDDYFRDLLFGRLNGRWLLHLHVVVSMGWLVLVGVQAWLAMSGRTALHIAVGRWGMWLGVVVVVIGLGFALLLVAERAAERGPVAVERTFTAPLFDMLVFSIFLGGAWITRRRPDFHKRYILLAATALIIPGVGRLPFFNGTSSVALADVVPYLLLWLSPVLIAVIHDWRKQRLIHPVYIFGIGVLVALRYRQLVRETDTWRDFMHWLAAVLT